MSRILISMKKRLEKITDEVKELEDERQSLLIAIRALEPKPELPSQPAVSHGAQAASESSKPVTPTFLGKGKHNQDSAA